MNHIATGLKKLGLGKKGSVASQEAPPNPSVSSEKPAEVISKKVVVVGLRENQAHLKGSLPADTMYVSRREVHGVLQDHKGSIAVMVVLPPNAGILDLCRKVGAVDSSIKVIVATNSRTMTDECKKKKIVVGMENTFPGVVKTLLASLGK